MMTSRDGGRRSWTNSKLAQDLDSPGEGEYRRDPRRFDSQEGLWNPWPGLPGAAAQLPVHRDFMPLPLSRAYQQRDLVVSGREILERLDGASTSIAGGGASRSVRNREALDLRGRPRGDKVSPSAEPSVGVAAGAASPGGGITWLGERAWCSAGGVRADLASHAEESSARRQTTVASQFRPATMLHEGDAGISRRKRKRSRMADQRQAFQELPAAWNALHHIVPVVTLNSVTQLFLDGRPG